MGEEVQEGNKRKEKRGEERKREPYWERDYKLSESIPRDVLKQGSHPKISSA